MQAEPDIPTWLMTLLAAGFFGGLGALAFWIAQRRRVGFERLAARRGLTYHHEGRIPVHLPAEFIDEIERGLVVASDVRRALTGAVDRMHVAVCDLARFRAKSGGGEQSHYSLTVVHIELDVTPPTFALDPQKLRHRLSPTARETDINFSDSPIFSKRCWLRGEDEHAVRERFSHAVRRFFERHPGRCVRCYGAHLVYYRPVRLLRWASFRPAPVEHLLDEALELSRLLRP